MTTFLPIVFSTDDLSSAPDIIIGKNTMASLPVPLDPGEEADLAAKVRHIEFWNTGTVRFKGFSGPDRVTIDPAGNVAIAGNVAAVGAVAAASGAFAGGVATSSLTAATATIGNLTATSFSANFKLFDIEHPSNPERRLRHGSLEGPELGVYVRGKTSLSSISLPHYWNQLVDPWTITIQLTPTHMDQKLTAGYPNTSSIYVDGSLGYEYHYFIQGERRDVPKLIVES